MQPQPIHFDPYAHTGLPHLGIRNYWYPALAGFRLGRKPKAVKLLGEDIVVYRDGGKVYALQDRCAHRGAKLSMGKCQYPGSASISCPYHGWTYNGRNRPVRRQAGRGTRLADSAAGQSEDLSRA